MSTLCLPGRTLYYEIHGEGFPLIYVGGFGLTTGAHVATVDEGLRERFRIIVFDHAGLGRSDPAPGPGRTEEIAVDVAELARHLDLSDGFHLAGTGGLGACVAQHLAIMKPPGLRKVILSQGWAFPEPFHTAQSRTFYTLRQQSYEAYATYGVTVAYLPEDVNAHYAELIRVAPDDTSAAARKDAHLRLIHANMTHDARDGLGSIRVPVLVVCAELDQLGAPRLSRDLADRVPGARFHQIPGAPHVISSVRRARAERERAFVSFLTEN
ncbi:alpha/beta fold hydrolase [Microtetraspora fusca]|uniref:Alpha/beta fold hydrolase n=1 Tax=Microtetraspora fusca TaxID=1997 RepID=A0ABW6VLX7_MICFU